MTGTVLSISDFDAIAAAILWRQDHFENELLSVSIKVVLYGFGDKSTKVGCIHGEWSGVKGDLEPTDGIPKCSNGHVLVQGGRGKRLGLVDVEGVENE